MWQQSTMHKSIIKHHQTQKRSTIASDWSNVTRPFIKRKLLKAGVTTTQRQKLKQTPSMQTHITIALGRNNVMRPFIRRKQVKASGATSCKLLQNFVCYGLLLQLHLTEIHWWKIVLNHFDPEKCRMFLHFMVFVYVVPFIYSKHYVKFRWVSALKIA